MRSLEIPRPGRAGVDGLSFATLATLEPDGPPHTSVV